jgi:hypothetical protein
VWAQTNAALQSQISLQQYGSTTLSNVVANSFTTNNNATALGVVSNIAASYIPASSSNSILTLNGFGTNTTLVNSPSITVTNATAKAVTATYSTNQNLTILASGTGGSSNDISQTMGTDNWRIYGVASPFQGVGDTDHGEMVFELADNANTYGILTGQGWPGERFRYSYTAAWNGVPKDAFIIDYDHFEVFGNGIIGNALVVGLSTNIYASTNLLEVWGGGTYEKGTYFQQNQQWFAMVEQIEHGDA